MLQTMAGHDPKDSTSSRTQVDNYLEKLSSKPTGLTIGLPKEYFSAALHDDIRTAIDDAIKVLEKQGHHFKEINLPHTDYAKATYYAIAPLNVHQT